MPLEQSRQRRHDLFSQRGQLAVMTTLGGELQLPAQAVVLKELQPAGACAVRLWCRPDKIVPVPAETLSRPPVLRGQLFAQAFFDQRARATKIQPFERKEAGCVCQATAKHLRYTNGLRRRQRCQAILWCRL